MENFKLVFCENDGFPHFFFCGFTVFERYSIHGKIFITIGGKTVNLNSTNNCNISDCSESTESVSCFETNFTSESIGNLCHNEIVTTQECIYFGDKIVPVNNHEQTLHSLTNSRPNNYKNINVQNSQNIHIGNITNIHGPVVINQNVSTINQRNTINFTTNNNDSNFPVVPRRTWLAQPPINPDDVKHFTEIPRFVIINHSATEEAFTQTENNLLVRLIQQFHIESLKWNDIAYNFLVGAEGTIYEGRGWKVIGAHTLGYNSIAIGICFVGCYMKKLPPAEVLKKVQTFIKYGVKAGVIAEDYTLLAHCQCRSSENPGSTLFEEIKTWDRWDGSISINNPYRKVSS